MTAPTNPPPPGYGQQPGQPGYGHQPQQQQPGYGQQQPPAQPSYGQPHQPPAHSPAAYGQQPAYGQQQPQPGYGHQPSYGQQPPQQPAPGQYNPANPTGYGYPGQQQQPAPTPQKSVNPGAKLGWLGALVGIPVGPLGIVMGTMSIQRSRKAGMSFTPGLVAVIVGALSFLTIIGLVLWAVFGPTPLKENAGDTTTERTISTQDFAVGNCILNESPNEDEFTQVPCSQGHGAEVVSIYEPSGALFPGEDELWQEAGDICSSAATSALPKGVDTANLTVSADIPTEEDWAAGYTNVTCFIVTYDGSDTMVGSAARGDLAVN